MFPTFIYRRASCHKQRRNFWNGIFSLLHLSIFPVLGDDIMCRSVHIRFIRFQDQSSGHFPRCLVWEDDGFFTPTAACVTDNAIWLLIVIAIDYLNETCIYVSLGMEVYYIVCGLTSLKHKIMYNQELILVSNLITRKLTVRYHCVSRCNEHAPVSTPSGQDAGATESSMLRSCLLRRSPISSRGI